MGGGLHGRPARIGGRCAAAVVRAASEHGEAEAGRTGQCAHRARLLPGVVCQRRAQGRCPSAHRRARAKHVQRLFCGSRRGRIRMRPARCRLALGEWAAEEAHAAKGQGRPRQQGWLHRDGA
eukprot:5491835-Prymnesium_polylepis.1